MGAANREVGEAKDDNAREVAKLAVAEGEARLEHLRARQQVNVDNRELAEVFRNGDQAQIYQNWVGSNGVKPSPMLIAMYLVQGLSE